MFKILALRRYMYEQSSAQGSKIALVRLYLGVPQAAGQVKILIFLVNFFPPNMSIILVMQGKCLF